MARSFNGSSDKATASLPSLTDFSISVRFKPNSTPSGSQCVVAWDNFPSSPRNYMVIQQSNAGSSGKINVDVGVAGTGGSSVAGAATLSSGTWYQMGASRASTTCKAWKDGAQIGSSWTVGSGSFTPSGFRFGCHNFNSSDQEFAPTTIAEGGLWSVELTASEWASLAKGISPKLVRPQSLVACWPIIGRVSPEPDLRGAYSLTLTGTSQADHPRVHYPGRRKTVFAPGAGGGFSDATGSSSLTFAASAVGSSLASVTGSSSIAFTPTAAGSSLADADGTAALTFAPTATGSALADATGSATLTFTATAVGSALADTAGSVALTFTASAVGSSQIDATGAATLAFAASAVGSSIADAAGTATLTFTASASSDGGTSSTGSATLTFTASATGSALVSAAGSSTLTFAVSATGAALADADGTATLTFSCSAVSSDESQVAALEITATLTTLLSLSVSVASSLNLEVTVTDRFDVEEQGMPSPQVGDIGTPIVVTVRDVAGEIMPLGATTLRQVILSRRGVTRTYSASLYTDGADGKIVYTSQDGDFDVAGPWLARGRVEFGGGAQHWTSPPVNFTVEGA